MADSTLDHPAVGPRGVLSTVRKNVSVATHLCMPRWKIATIVIRYATKTKLTVSKQCWGGPSTILSSLICCFDVCWNPSAIQLIPVQTKKCWKAFLLFNCLFTVRTAGIHFIPAKSGLHKTYAHRRSCDNILTNCSLHFHGIIMT